MVTQEFLRSWIETLGAAFCKTPGKKTIDYYAERLAEWDLTDTQWQSALKRIVDELEKFPTLSQIYPFLAAVQAGTKDRLGPVFQTWRDSEGRCWAKPTGKFQSANFDYERMGFEKVSREEAYQAFSAGFRQTNPSGKVPLPGWKEKEIFESLQPTVKPAKADYDDSEIKKTPHNLPVAALPRGGPLP